MFRLVFCFFSLLWCYSCYSATQNVPENTRRTYALKFHEAFILQSAGLSTKAFYLFSEAYQEALRAGETFAKVVLLEDLFKWYRIHGSSMHLFGKEPTGSDRIVPSPFNKKPTCRIFIPTSPLAVIPNYQSEWGKTPEQAAQIRMFMFGVAQVISGVFCVTAGGVVAFNLGWGIITTGIGTMVGSLNTAYSDYERALLDLKTFEANAKKIADN